MGNFSEKIFYIASIGIASPNICRPPFNILDFTWNVFTKDVIFKNLIVWDVGVVNADKNDSGFFTIIDKNLVKDFWNGHFSIFVIKEDFLRVSFNVIKFNHSMCSGVNVQWNVTVCSQPSASIFNGSPANKS